MQNQWEIYVCLHSISVKSFYIYNCKFYILMWIFIIFINTNRDGKNLLGYGNSLPDKKNIPSGSLEYLPESSL